MQLHERDILLSVRGIAWTAHSLFVFGAIDGEGRLCEEGIKLSTLLHMCVRCVPSPSAVAAVVAAANWSLTYSLRKSGRVGLA